MNKRPPITLVLDVRSHETVYVCTDPSAGHRYQQNWIVWEAGANIPQLDYDANGQAMSVVILDGVDLLRRELGQLMASGPRILAAIVADLEQEKRFRRNLRQLYPWSEVWETFSDMGKVLMTTAWGRQYEREHVVDMREAATA